MRPLRLDLQGFTVFREPTTVDFTDADFFALVGPTGAGKSTILDAICFALYGTVPRWGDRRRIENALAPSSTQAKVRLVFEASGVRYVATRVVRRDGKGRVSTAHAGLEQLPAGFDLRLFDESAQERIKRVNDTAPAERAEALGTVLAGTWSEMEAAVLDAVGLPYEQFTSCVVLPQGEFARFLHAKPAERQEILVNLLGLHVYQRIGERAGVRHRDAEANVNATRSLLGEVSSADDTALRAADQALTAAETLVADVEARLPALDEVRLAGESAATQLARVERELATLAAVAPPAGLTSLHTEFNAARDAMAATRSEVDSAEDREEKARAELAAAGDRTALSRLLDTHAELGRHRDRAGQLAAGLAAAQAEHDSAATRVAKAEAGVNKADQTLRLAVQGVEAAQTADRASSLRVHLVAGEPCPVCEQRVATVPAMGNPTLKAARDRLVKAEKAAQLAAETAAADDRTLREADRRLAGIRAQHEESTTRLSTLDKALAGAPDMSAVEEALTAIAAHEVSVAAGAEAVRAARHAARSAVTRLATAEERLRRAWREYDAARDAVAALGPPTADRDQLVQSWKALTAWASAQQAERARDRDAAIELAQAALAALTAITADIDKIFEVAPGATRAPGTPDAAGYRQAAALAVARATSARDRVLERREQAGRLRDQLALHERDAQVAKALAQHLRANQFERWLLTEALDSLVEGASGILKELSNGRYELAHSDGEFTVVDHADASMHRAVRTLSGGETFQAALALALALSEQLAGLTTATASLESIMLDEGFGTLDADTLDTVAATLENLAARGDRMVGVVTHVAGLAERIPVRFEVSRDPRSGSARIVRTTT